MSTRITDLFLLEDLDDVEKTNKLAQSDLDALRAVGDWIENFVVRPHEDLGRAGPVCPFVPRSVERRTLWLAPERAVDRNVAEVVDLVNDYQSLLLAAEPRTGDEADDKVVVIVLTDVSADRARGLFDDVLQRLAVPSYVEDGIVFGPFYEGHEGTAIYNASFHPFRSPVPFLFVRRGVVDDWKFFLDQPGWLGHWAHRFGESAAVALADELRHLPWRARHDH